jgi:hypothetical protein
MKNLDVQPGMRTLRDNYLHANLKNIYTLEEKKHD